MPARSPRSPRALRANVSGWEESAYFKMETVPSGRDRDPPGARIVHTRQSRVGQADEAFGDRVMSRGEHRFVFTIACAHSSTGSGLVLGVAAAAGSEHVRQKIGIRPSDGRLVRVPAPEPVKGGERDSRPVLLAENCMPRASERAVGRRVEIIVDLERKQVAFSVDGASAVDSGVLPEELPSTLVPWVQVFFKGDAVTLSHHRVRAPKPGSSPRSPPPPVKVSALVSRAYDQSKFEAGPWVA